LRLQKGVEATARFAARGEHHVAFIAELAKRVAQRKILDAGRQEDT
jgi:hypothetical protein